MKPTAINSNIEEMLTGLAQAIQAKQPINGALIERLKMPNGD